METVGEIKTLGITGCNAVLGYLCTLKEGVEFISIDDLEIGKKYPILSFHFNTEKGAGDNFYTEAELVKESDHPDANLYLKLEIDHAIRYVRIVGNLDIFKKIKEKGLGTIAISNRAFTVPSDQILIKGIHYPSVERANPKLDIKRMFGDKAILSDDGYYVLLNDEDMAKYTEYCNSCIDITPILIEEEK